MSDQGSEAHLGSVLRYAVAAASLGAGLIHVTAIFDHTGHAVAAAFFVVLAVVQVAWAAAMVPGRDHAAGDRPVHRRSRVPAPDLQSHR